MWCFGWVPNSRKKESRLKIEVLLQKNDKFSEAVYSLEKILHLFLRQFPETDFLVPFTAWPQLTWPQVHSMVLF